MEKIDYTQFKILIVDDVPLNLKVVEKMLAKYKFQLTKAADGQSAIDAIKADEPHLVLLDLMMPGIDGFEVLRQIRSGALGNPNIPVVILSALSSNEDIARGLSLGANDYITKPIIMQRLFNVVETQIRLLTLQNS